MINEVLTQIVQRLARGSEPIHKVLADVKASRSDWSDEANAELTKAIYERIATGELQRRIAATKR